MIVVFVTLTFQNYAQTATDIDGNVYRTVTIGTQEWMAENLKTSKYNDGSSVIYVSNSAEWTVLPIPAYCWYQHSSSMNTTYGSLYNWYAVEAGNLCPSGWHVPSDEEWTVLTDFIGGANVAGGKLKETGTYHWNNPNTGATDEFGFTALPGGARYYSGSFADRGFKGWWWSSTGYDDLDAYRRGLDCYDTLVLNSHVKKSYGYSIRCVKDNNASVTNSLHPEEVFLYPNPACDKLYLGNSNYANSLTTISDIQGKQVVINQIDPGFIDISNLKNGIYFIKIEDSGGVMITKFIKE